MRSIVPATRRQRVTNYGDAVTITDKGRPALFTTQKGDGFMMLLTVQCVEVTIPGPAVGTADFRPMVHVSWGNGASSVDGDFDCTFRQRIPFACSTVEVSAFIGAFPLPGVVPPSPLVAPDGARVKLRAFVSEGIDGERLVPTQWTTQFGAATGVLRVGQARLAALRAWAPPPTTLTAVPYFLLFDQPTAPVAGDLPVDGQPLQVAGPITAALGTSVPSPLMWQGDTRGYVRGVAWGISSSPFVFAADVDGLEAFVAAEFMS